MGKKKWCFGREDVVCLTKDCPYMSDCIQVVWRKKMARLIERGIAAGSADSGGTVPKLKSTLKAEANERKKLLRRTSVATPASDD